jgi:hypothetical protein
MCSRGLAKSALGLLLTGAAIALATGAVGQEKGKKPPKGGVIVLIDAKTEGIAQGAKIKQIETPKDSTGKQEIKEDKSRGKYQPRLYGIWVVKSCIITLADGKTLEKRDVLVAIDVGKRTLKDLKYVETCEAQSDKGAGKWYAYTAEYEVRE